MKTNLVVSISKVLALVIALVFSVMATRVSAQQLGYFHDYMPTHIGPRAHGLAGAYTALVDDANAVAWNPGALGMIRSTSLVSAMSFSYRIGSITSSVDNGIFFDAERSDVEGHFGVNNISLAIPINLFDQEVQLVPAFSYHHISNYRHSVENWNMKYSQGFDNIDYDIEFDHTGGRSAYSFGLGLNISDYLGLGVVYNLFTGERVESVNQSISLNTGFSESNSISNTTVFGGGNLNFGIKASSSSFNDIKIMPGDGYTEGVDFGLSLRLPHQSTRRIFDNNNSSDSTKYLFNEPLMIRSGLAFRLPDMMMAFDFSYADFSKRRGMQLNQFNSGFSPGDGISLYSFSIGLEFENMYRVGIMVRNYQFKTNENLQEETFTLTGGFSIADDENFILDVSAALEFFSWDELEWGLYNDTFNFQGVTTSIMAGLRIFLD
jgi:hypothetical protein